MPLEGVAFFGRQQGRREKIKLPAIEEFFLTLVQNAVSPGPPLQRSHKSHQISFLLLVEFERQDEVEELHRIVQCQEPVIMQVGR